jgi:hypothetical protein
MWGWFWWCWCRIYDALNVFIILFYKSLLLAIWLEKKESKSRLEGSPEWVYINQRIKLFCLLSLHYIVGSIALFIYHKSYCFWVDPGSLIWPVTRSLYRVNHQVGLKTMLWSIIIPQSQIYQVSFFLLICHLIYLFFMILFIRFKIMINNLMYIVKNNFKFISWF